MRRFLSFVGLARVWLLGLAVWALIGSTAGPPHIESASAAQGVEWARGVGGLTGYLLIVSVLRVFWPMRVSRSNPWKLIGGGKTYRVHTFTGRSGNVTKMAVTETSGDGYVSDAGGYVSGRMTITSRTQMHDQFFLTDASGRQQGFQVVGEHLPLGNDQLLSAAWGIAPRRRTGTYVVFVNHSTGATTFAWSGLARIALGARPGWSVIWALSTGVLLPVGGYPAAGVAALGALFAFGIVSRLQRRLFRRVTSAPLLRQLRAQGASAAAATVRVVEPAVPAPVPSPEPPVLPATVIPPVAPALAPAPVPALHAPPPTPAGWHPDPHARHERRFWDGRRWTEHVTDAGVPGVDPPA